MSASLLNGRTFPLFLSDDVQASTRFYVALGYRVGADLGWFVSLAVEGERATTELALCEAGHAWLPPDVRTWPAGRAVLTVEVADADAAAARLTALGGHPLTAPVNEPWGQRQLFAQAPGGAVLNINAHCAPDPAWMKANGFG